MASDALSRFAKARARSTPFGVGGHHRQVVELFRPDVFSSSAPAQKIVHGDVEEPLIWPSMQVLVSTRSAPAVLRGRPRVGCNRHPRLGLAVLSRVPCIGGTAVILAAEERLKASMMIEEAPTETLVHRVPTGWIT